MPSLNVSELAQQMLAAATGILTGKAPGVLDYAKTEFEKIGNQCVLIGEQYAQGQLTEEGAQALLQMQINSSKILLLTLEGLSLLVVEAAINAALQVAKTAVNTALGVALIA